jgi:hypothetical protein
MSQELLDNDMKNDPSQGGVVIEKNHSIYHFTGMDKEVLADKVQQYLAGKGYKLEEGTKFMGKYGKGSKVGRILFGAFVKRFCWEIRVEQTKDWSRLMLIKDAKGYAGGVIGVNQVNNEYGLLSNSIKDWHAKVNGK